MTQVLLRRQLQPRSAAAACPIFAVSSLHREQHRDQAPTVSKRSRRIPTGRTGVPCRETALDQLDVELAPAEILGLIGPNGAGKTTLVNVLTGFQRPTAGSIRIGRRDMTGRAPRER